MDWNLKLIPTGVEDMGYSPVSSPLEALDELFCRTAKGLPADDVAARPVLAQVREVLSRTPRENGLPTLGTLMSPYPAENAPEFCVDFEDFGLDFSGARVNGKFFLTAMRELSHCPAAIK